MENTRMDMPDTREEFERRMNIMHNHVVNGKVLFCEGLTDVIEGICDLHAMPNGRVDLLTVNEAARLQSSSGEWSGNLFDFYFRVYNKMIKDIKVPFKMQGGFRIDDTPVHRALWEALAN